MSSGAVHQGAFKVALAALDTAGGIISLLNPEKVDLIVTQIVLDVTTVATGACTVDVGCGSGATTSYDNLIDGQDVNSAAGAFGSPSGTNGKPCIRWESDGYLTASMATGAAAGLAGYAYIHYMRV